MLASISGSGQPEADEHAACATPGAGGAYLDGVVGGPAHLVGWSDGAVLSLAAVAAPTLVLQGDRDEVTLEHGSAVAAVLPQGRFAILPGTHALPLENPDVVNALLLWFLLDWTSGGQDS